MRQKKESKPDQGEKAQHKTTKDTVKASAKAIAKASGVGEKLRAVRKKRGLSLEQVSELTGVPGATISRIENNKVSPTLDIIQKIINGLHLGIGELFTPVQFKRTKPEINLRRSEEGKVTELSNFIYKMLHPDVLPCILVPSLVSTFARTVEEYGGYMHHEGEEFLYVMQGSLELCFEDRDSCILNEGDSIYFQSHLPHAYIALGGRQAKMLIVSTTPDPSVLGVSDT